MQSTGWWSDGHGKVEDGCPTFSWQGTRWWYDSHGNVQDVVRQSLKGTGWWSYSHGNVQDGGLTVIARYRIVI